VGLASLFPSGSEFRMKRGRLFAKAWLFLYPKMLKHVVGLASLFPSGSEFRMKSCRLFAKAWLFLYPKMLKQVWHFGIQKKRIAPRSPLFLLSDPVGIRTPNLRIRSAMLYPIELQSHFETFFDSFSRIIGLCLISDYKF
jgi:hypothetical protein